MILEWKRPDHVVPEYSLTGDLLSFRLCEMQYRYYNGSSLPPSRPVQLWYGEFIHGVLEEAYRLWDAQHTAFPWPYTEIEEDAAPGPPPDGLDPRDLRQLAWPIERALMQQNKRARSRRARRSAYIRAHQAINILGPRLFGLINVAEQRLIGTRDMLPEDGGPRLRSSRYVLTGVIDVLTHMELNASDPENPIVRAVREACPDLEGDFEVIVDYKSSHRPRSDEERHWLVGEWQVKTYGWLRQRQPDAPRVAAGVLLYLNELSPSSHDIERLRREIANGWTDVRPRRGSRDDLEMQLARAGTSANLSEEFRLQRAIRVVRIDEASLDEATGQFDGIVREIERRISTEERTGSISATWPPTSDDKPTCAACDFRSFCPRSALTPQDDPAEYEDDEV